MVDAKEILEFSLDRVKDYEQKLEDNDGNERVNKGHLDAHLRILKTFGERFDEDWYDEIKSESSHL